MSYKDQTFCNDWCSNTNCFRNYQHIVEAQKPDGFLALNNWMPVSFFVDIPMDCTIRIPKETS